MPVNKLTPLAEFEGSVIVERTAGEVSARCHDEQANLLALNLTNDIVRETKTPQQARAYYAQEFALAPDDVGSSALGDALSVLLKKLYPRSQNGLSQRLSLPDCDIARALGKPTCSTLQLNTSLSRMNSDTALKRKRFGWLIARGG